ncbi:unnamed protein product [Lepeophtheirus salmonis]|uniref:(salmon louse) hypothetical protein n=1 Tax=Lepeophtheirus salmonis TaxID=72036 RepID=A0A7R8HC72_LEPSM|nr:unnamed protein product [Lepeophtheirus salmonis]CAF2996721.1 unnamed protein product [Lepeophtheirus salmonis]
MLKNRSIKTELDIKKSMDDSRGYKALPFPLHKKDGKIEYRCDHSEKGPFNAPFAQRPSHNWLICKSIILFTQVKNLMCVLNAARDSPALLTLKRICVFILVSAHIFVTFVKVNSHNLCISNSIKGCITMSDLLFAILVIRLISVLRVFVPTGKQTTCKPTNEEKSVPDSLLEQQPAARPKLSNDEFDSDKLDCPSNETEQQQLNHHHHHHHHHHHGGGNNYDNFYPDHRQMTVTPVLDHVGLANTVLRNSDAKINCNLPNTPTSINHQPPSSIVSTSITCN